VSPLVRAGPKAEVNVSTTSPQYTPLGFPAGGEAPKLSRVLKIKRATLRIPQIDIATALGFTQAYISHLENGVADTSLSSWPGEQQYRVLKTYRFSDGEIEALAGEYGLSALSGHMLLLASQKSAMTPERRERIRALLNEALRLLDEVPS
jgi:transcriptional regulator with XRE-family HTH domain